MSRQNLGNGMHFASFRQRRGLAELVYRDTTSAKKMENARNLSLEDVKEMEIILKHIRNAKINAEVIQNV